VCALDFFFKFVYYLTRMGASIIRRRGKMRYGIPLSRRFGERRPAEPQFKLNLLHFNLKIW